MSQRCNVRACDSGALLPRDSVLPGLVRCLCGFLLSLLRYVEVAVSMTSDRRVSRSWSRRRPAKTASRIMPRVRGFQMSRGCDVSRSLEPDS